MILLFNYSSIEPTYYYGVDDEILQNPECINFSQLGAASASVTVTANDLGGKFASESFTVLLDDIAPSGECNITADGGILKTQENVSTLVTFRTPIAREGYSDNNRDYLRMLYVYDGMTGEEVNATYLGEVNGEYLWSAVVAFNASSSSMPIYAYDWGHNYLNGTGTTEAYCGTLNYVIDADAPVIDYFYSDVDIVTTTEPFIGDNCSALESCGVITNNVTFSFNATDFELDTFLVVYTANNTTVSGCNFSDARGNMVYNGSCIYDATSLNHGESVSFNLIVKDTAGNENVSDPILIQVDNLGPTIENVDFSRRYVQSNVPINISGNISDSGPASFIPNDDVNSRVWVESEESCYDSCNGIVNTTEGFFIKEMTFLTEGMKNVSLAAKDNISNYNLLYAYVYVDDTAPIVTSVDPANNSIIGAELNITYTMTDNYVLNSSTALYCISATPSCTTTQDLVYNGSHFINHSINTTVFGDGVYYINGSVMDRADNLGFGSILNITIDTIAPNITFNFSDGILVGKNYTYVVNVTDEHLNTSRINLTLNGTVYAPTATIGDAYYFEINNTGLNGVYEVNVTAYDLAYPVNMNESNITVNIDTLPPNVTVLTALEDTILSGVHILQADIVDSAGNLNISNSSGCRIEDGPWYPLVLNSGDTYNCTINTTEVSDILSATILINVTDNADNVGYESINVSVDNTAPAIDLANLTDYIVQPEQLNITINSTTYDYAPFTAFGLQNCSIYYSEDAILDGGDYFISELNSNCTGGFDVPNNTIVSENDSRYVILQAYDIAGNANDTSIAITIDDSIPQVTTLLVNGSPSMYVHPSAEIFFTVS